ncbi:MAG: hypothetical protein ABSE51_22740 [Terracidiphilus sp.]|jgi:hypothetical protein
MTDRPKFDEYKSTLRKLCECLENLSIEADSYRQSALSLGANVFELEAAKDAALNDPEIRSQARKDYEKMWEVLETSSDSAYFEDLLLSLELRGKPN